MNKKRLLLKNKNIPIKTIIILVKNKNLKFIKVTNTFYSDEVFYKKYILCSLCSKNDVIMLFNNKQANLLSNFYKLKTALFRDASFVIYG